MKGRDIKVEPKPPKEEIKKIREALRLRANDPLPRCMGKHVHRGKESGHDEPGHLCDYCRCKHVAGHGTKHYGYGYCMCHENANQYKDKALDMAHAQKVATQQGQPENVYKYITTLDHIDGIREAADAAKGRHQLKEEIVVLRSLLQHVLQMQSDRINVSQHEPPKDLDGHEKLMWLEHRHVSSKEINSIATLTRTIGTLAKTELEVTDSDYVHVDEVKTWLFRILRLIQEKVEDIELQQILLEDMAQIPNPEAGKK